jgi:hypothetical protein
MGAVPDRYVIVVPASAPETLDYLVDSFRNVPDVQVVLDRRRRRPAGTPAPVERRVSRWSQEAFGCTLVRLGPAAPEPASGHTTTTTPASSSHERSSIRLRTLPLLRQG